MKIISFGLKHRDLSDVAAGITERLSILDLRKIANPYRVPELAHLTGKSPLIAEWIKKRTPHFDRTMDEFLDRSLASNVEVIVCYCKGGRHRSVFYAEELGRRLKDRGVNVDIEHKELKDGQ